jgi:hypothetical protein
VRVSANPEASPIHAIDAWQCIGCGRVEAPQNCVGICEDRRVKLVHASAYAAVSDEASALRRERDALRSLVARLAWSHPRPDQWQRSYRALQVQARALLSTHELLSDQANAAA